MPKLFSRAGAGVLSLVAAACMCAPAFAQQDAPPTDKAAPTEKAAPPMPAPPRPDHGPGASGTGDGSGMGQDTSEIGTPKGPGDKGGPPADKTVAPKICDNGRQPTDGACPD